MLTVVLSMTHKNLKATKKKKAKLVTKNIKKSFGLKAIQREMVKMCLFLITASFQIWNSFGCKGGKIGCF